jgi:glucosamine 6-phosphate synthetase-like amidotransferase/phosphosugar isomerase protein
MHEAACAGMCLRAQLVSEVLGKLEGAYGLLVKSAYYPGELVAAKLGSPLLLGVKEGAAGAPRPPQLSSSPARRQAPAAAGDGAFEAFVASDASAFVEHTNQCARVLNTEHFSAEALLVATPYLLASPGTEALHDWAEAASAACDTSLPGAW